MISYHLTEGQGLRLLDAGRSDPHAKIFAVVQCLEAVRKFSRRPKNHHVKIVRLGDWWGTSTGQFIVGFHETEEQDVRMHQGN